MIDTKRLATDAAYWDECGAPDDATHYCPVSRLFYNDNYPIAPCCIPRPKAPEAEWVDGLPPEGIAEFRKSLALNLQNSIEAITGGPFGDDDSLILAHEIMVKYDLSKKLKFGGD